MSCRLLTSRDFARLLDIHATKARDALRRMANGLPFAPRHLGKGAAKRVLPVQRLGGLPGGARGERFAVNQADIPREWVRRAELLDEIGGGARSSTAIVRYITQPPPLIVPAASRAVIDAPFFSMTEAHAIGEALALVPDRRTRIAQAAALIANKTMPGTAERGALVAGVCAVVKQMAGPRFSRATLYSAITRGGEISPRKKRLDARKKRVHLSCSFDAFAIANGVAPERLPELAERVRRRIRGGWASQGGHTGWCVIRDNIGEVIRCLFQECGVIIPAPTREQLETLIPAHVVKRERRYLDLSIRKHDAGRHHARHSAPVRRSIAGLMPGQIVCIDVKTIDVNILCDDRKLRSVKMAAVMDVATGYLFHDLLDPNEKRGIRQSDTLTVLARVCRDFAVAEIIQRDNGGEYDTPALYREIGEIVRCGIYGDRQPLRDDPELKAKPYNSRAKPIEAAFRRAQAVIFELIPGAHSGQWSNKRTERMGQKPTPYPGTFAEFRAAFDKLMNMLNTDTPFRKGERKGKTPRELLDEAISAGWKAPAQLTEDEVGFIFSRREVRTVQPGGKIDWAPGVFYHPALCSTEWQGKKVEVRWPLVGHDPSAERVLHVVDPKTQRRICIARDERAPFISQDGIDRRRRYDHEERERLAALAAEIEPYDPFNGAMARAAALPPPTPIPTHATARVAPDGPSREPVSDQTSELDQLTALDAPEHRKKREREARRKFGPDMTAANGADAFFGRKLALR